MPFQTSRTLPNLCTATATTPKVRQKRRRNNGRDGVRDELEGGRRVECVGGTVYGKGGSSLGSCSQGVGQHERQDVMVYSAQEWERRGQGAPCPQHQPQRDL